MTSIHLMWLQRKMAVMTGRGNKAVGELRGLFNCDGSPATSWFLPRNLQSFENLMIELKRQYLTLRSFGRFIIPFP